MAATMAATYDTLAGSLPQAIAAATDRQAAMFRAITTLKEALPHYSWVGIYVLEGTELVLGPYLGKPSPHTRIPLNSGICGAAASEKATIIVDDVNSDPRYLACSLETRSEIVVPIILFREPQSGLGDLVLGEIDIDSDQPAAFTAADRVLLEQVAAALAEQMKPRSHQT